jgi:CRP-like cAMP-binding protein
MRESNDSIARSGRQAEGLVRVVAFNVGYLKLGDLIAAALGTHRETVTRAVRSLVQKAWIESRRKRITLLDRDALRQFAS